MPKGIMIEKGILGTEILMAFALWKGGLGTGKFLFLRHSLFLTEFRNNQVSVPKKLFLFDRPFRNRPLDVPKKCCFREIRLQKRPRSCT